MSRRRGGCRPRSSVPAHRRSLWLLSCLLAWEPARAAGPAAGSWDPPREGTLTADHVNVRLGPGFRHENLGALGAGAKVAVRRVTADGWCEIDYPASFGVWVSGRYVEPKGDPAAASLEAPVVGKVTARGLSVRAVPRTDAPVVSTAERGDEVAIVGAFRDWYRLAPPPGLRAYLSAKYVEIAAPPEPPAAEAVPGLVPVPSPEPAPGIPKRLAHVEETIASAGKTLLEARSAAEAVGALAQLSEVLASGEVTTPERPAVQRRVAEVLGAVPPARWADLLARAGAEALAGAQGLARGPSGRDDAARGEPAGRPLPAYDAVGVLLAPEAGSQRFRLAVEGAVVLELDAGPADLTPFLGKAVGVQGERKPPARLGEAPWIAVRSIHELPVKK